MSHHGFESCEFLNAGLGFDDCSARVTEIPDSDFDATHSVKLENQGTEHAPWNYYSFGISENNYHVVASVEAQTNGSDRCKHTLQGFRSRFYYFQVHLNLITENHSSGSPFLLLPAYH